MLTTTTTSGEDPEQSAAPEPHVLAAQFASSPRGARRARHLAARRMEEWGYPPPSDASCTVALLVGELAANAVHHGNVRGRDFRLALSLDEAAGLIRIEVADAAAKRPPTSPPPSSPDAEAESGRGLLLVDVLAVRWGSAPRDHLGKTVWAEVAAGTPTPAVSFRGRPPMTDKDRP